jgi:hypothetical protein
MELAGTETGLPGAASSVGWEERFAGPGATFEEGCVLKNWFRGELGACGSGAGGAGNDVFEKRVFGVRSRRDRVAWVITVELVATGTRGAWLTVGSVTRMTRESPVRVPDSAREPAGRTRALSGKPLKGAKSLSLETSIECTTRYSLSR